MTVLTDLGNTNIFSIYINSLSLLKSVRKSVMKSVRGVLSMTVSPAAAGPEPWEAAGRAMHAAGLMSDSTAVALGLAAPGAAGKRRAKR